MPSIAKSETKKTIVREVISLLRRLIVIIIILLISFNITLVVSSISNQTVEANSDHTWYNVGEFRERAYYRTLKRWNESYSIIHLDNELIFNLVNSSNLEENNLIAFENREEIIVATIEKNETLHFKIDVESTGLYELGLRYRPIDDFTNQPRIKININGEDQYNEITDIALDVSWRIQERAEDNRYNRYGNELLPFSTSVNQWYKHYLKDNNSRYLDPYKVLLEAGENIISITSFSEELQISHLYLNNSKPLTTYHDYMLQYQNVGYDEAIIPIQAEQFTLKNDIEIKAGYYKNVNMMPSSYKHTVLNMLDGTSSNRGGSKVTYDLQVEKTGLYHLSFKYIQNSLNGLSAAKTIFVDEKIPYQELANYQFPESNKWVNHTLNVDGEPLLIYLTEGHHTLSLETTIAHYNDYIEELYSIMDGINNLGLTITSITGGSKNTFTDWNILKYLPTIVEDLHGYADRIDAVYDAINHMNPKSKEASEITTLKIAAKQLRRLSTRPNKIHLKLAELNVGSGSAYQLIGTSIGTLLVQPISFDAIYVTMGDVKLPKANSNIFVRFWFSVRSFFYSFFDERYKYATNNKDGVLEVWIAQSPLYLDIIQSMVDDDFTAKTGVEVKVNILPTSQKIILNNATNTNPDVILSIDSWEPYRYALRGLLVDLSKFDGFDEVTSNIYANCFTPIIFEDGVYAIPETQGMNILFYRKDILNFLDLEVPSTWDDVVKILPILQSYQMNFYHPLGSDSSYKSFSSTTPFIYSFGGEVYSDNGITTIINSEANIEAIRYMTDLFNIYNLPLQVSNFFEHFRSGTLPIGIGTIDMYLLLKYASPELAGQWGISPVPGFDYDQDGEIERWTTAYGKSSILFKSSKMQKEGWEFIKWWNSTPIQTLYLQNIKMCLGEKFLVIPANIDALNASPWDQEIKVQVGLAAKWSRIPAVIPGSYVVERELSNIWNKVVINRMDVRVAVGQSVDKVNRELLRKHEEFGYVKNGVVVKEYIVPNNNNISLWIEGRPRDD